MAIKACYEPMPIQKNRFARSLAIKVIGLSRCIGLSRRTGHNVARTKRQSRAQLFAQH
jgi:hypothetical protein